MHQRMALGVVNHLRRVTWPTSRPGACPCMGSDPLLAWHPTHLGVDVLVGTVHSQTRPLGGAGELREAREGHCVVRQAVAMGCGCALSAFGLLAHLAAQPSVPLLSLCLPGGGCSLDGGEHAPSCAQGRARQGVLAAVTRLRRSLIDCTKLHLSCSSHCQMLRWLLWLRCDRPCPSSQRLRRGHTWPGGRQHRRAERHLHLGYVRCGGCGSTRVHDLCVRVWSVTVHMGELPHPRCRNPWLSVANLAAIRGLC